MQTCSIAGCCYGGSESSLLQRPKSRTAHQIWHLPVDFSAAIPVSWRTPAVRTPLRLPIPGLDSSRTAHTKEQIREAFSPEQRLLVPPSEVRSWVTLLVFHNAVFIWVATLVSIQNKRLAFWIHLNNNKPLLMSISTGLFLSFYFLLYEHLNVSTQVSPRRHRIVPYLVGILFILNVKLVKKPNIWKGKTSL